MDKFYLFWKINNSLTKKIAKNIVLSNIPKIQIMKK